MRAVELTTVQILLDNLLLRALIGSLEALRLQDRTACEVATSVDSLLERITFPAKDIVGVVAIAGTVEHPLASVATRMLGWFILGLTRRPGSRRMADSHRSATRKPGSCQYPRPSQRRLEESVLDGWKGMSCRRRSRRTRRGFRGPRCRGWCHPSSYVGQTNQHCALSQPGVTKLTWERRC